MEPLFLLTIPRYDIPEFGSLDEDYLCSEEQLSWYISDENMQAKPVHLLGQTSVHEENLEYEYTDLEDESWNFWLEKVDADCVYIFDQEVYRRCVKVRASNILIQYERPEEASAPSLELSYAYRRLGRVSGHSGILGIGNLSAMEYANDRSSRPNEVYSNLYFLEREFETKQEMDADIEHPMAVELRRFFEDILEQK